MLKSVMHVVVARAAMTVLVVAMVAAVVVVDVIRVNNVLCIDGDAAEFRPAVYKNVPKLLLAWSDSPRVVFMMTDAGDEKPMML